MSGLTRPAVGHPLGISALTVLAAPVAVYALGLLVRLVAIAPVPFPIHEGSAYYVAVARSLSEGRGLVIDAIWSYATPPLVLPRPAFELWQPLASFLAALPMTLVGDPFLAAQLGAALFGTLIAPLGWVVARDAARTLDLAPRRAAAVAVGSGVLAALLGPFLVGTLAPDSTIPFLVLGTLACLLMPRALTGGMGAGLALGLVLGAAYLARMEAVYLGLTFLLFAATTNRRQAAGGSGFIRRLMPVIAGGLLVTLPWLARNLLTFGSPFPGQAIENVLLTRNEAIFGYGQRPNLETFLGQGVETVAFNILRAMGHGLVDVVLVPGGVLTAAGLLTAFLLLRSSRLRMTSLGALLISGGLIYLSITIVFPIATLWGTFQHSAGPLLLGLTVCGAIGADWLVARLRQLRGWQRSNAWLAPAALVLLTAPLSYLQVSIAANQAQAMQARFDGLDDALPPLPPGPLISDRPIWLSQELGREALILPDEPPASVLQLARDFRARAVLIVEQRRGYPAALRSEAAATCFVEQPLGAGAPPETALFLLPEECLP